MQLVLGRYARERLLYRLGRSPYAEVFVLKGAMLFHLWSEELHRPTRDLDLLGFGESSVARLVRVFREVGAIEAEEEALQFDAAAIRGTVIREGQHYEGVRIRCLGLLGETRIPIQIDIGFGDAITPAAQMVTYPTLLDLPPPVIRAYPAESVVAEKFQALVDLGSTNSRMKDFYDLWMLARTRAFDGGTLSRAIRETFSRLGREQAFHNDVAGGRTLDRADRRRTCGSASLSDVAPDCSARPQQASDVTTPGRCRRGRRRSRRASCVP